MAQVESVYLREPAKTTRRPVQKSNHKPRRQAAAVMTLIGLVALTLAGTIGAFRSLVLNPDPVLEAFDKTLDDPLARAELEREIARGIEEDLIGAELTAAVAAFGVDVPAQSEAAAGAVLDDSQVRVELRSVAAEIHTRALVAPGTDPTVAVGGLTAAVIAVLLATSPELAGLAVPGAALWSIDASAIPNASGPASLATQFHLIAVAVGLLVPLAAIVHPNRYRVARWVGMWAMAFGGVTAVAAVALPYLGGNMTGWSTVEIAIRSLSLRLLAPAIAAGLFGGALLSVASFAQRRADQKVAQEGAAAALGYDEPPLWERQQANSLDLPSRGLVDVNHPLTNI